MNLAAPVTSEYVRPITAFGRQVGSLDVTVDLWPSLVKVKIASTRIVVGSGQFVADVRVSLDPQTRTPTPDLSLEVLAPATAIQASITIPPQEWRTYRDGIERSAKVDVTVYRVTAGVRTVYAESESLVVPVPAWGEPVPCKWYGAHAYPFIPENRDVNELTPFLDRLVEMGGNFVTINMPWSYLMPTEGVWNETDATKLEAFFTLCEARGLKVVVGTGGYGAPAYAQAPGAVFPYLFPLDSKIVAYITAYLARFGARTFAIEPHNEINSTNGGMIPNAAEDARVTNTILSTVRTIRPSVKVFTGALSEADYVYLEAMYVAGLGDVDAVAIHPYNITFGAAGGAYGDPVAPWTDQSAQSKMSTLVDGAQRVYETMVAHGHGDRPVWVTEYGVSNQPVITYPLPGLTNQQSYDYMRTAIEQTAHMPFLEGFSEHRLENPAVPNPTNWQDWFGMVTFPGTTPDLLTPQGRAYKDALAFIRSPVDLGAQFDYGRVTLDTYAALGHMTEGDDNLGFPLLRFVASMTERMRQVEDRARDTDERGGWSALVDVDAAPLEDLPWLGQFVGVSPGAIDQSRSEDEQRRTVRTEAGWGRGTLGSITQAAAKYLTGNRTVLVSERDGGDPYAIRVSVFQREVPALTYDEMTRQWQTYNDLTAQFATYDAFTSNIDLLRRAILAVKPAGIFALIEQRVGATYDELSTLFGTYADLTTTFATYDDMSLFIPVTSTGATYDRLGILYATYDAMTAAFTTYHATELFGG